MIQNLDERFDEKIKELNESLPKLKVSANCAELTLTSVLDILGIDNYIFHNLAIPLAGGFGGYKSRNGWQGACGAVSGGCSAIGVILGGHERISEKCTWAKKCYHYVAWAVDKVRKLTNRKLKKTSNKLF